MNICKEKGAPCMFAQASGYCCSTVCLGHIKKRPTIELKRGQWIENDNGDTVCSNCGKLEIEFVYGTENWYGVGESNYCPNCGAKMEK